MRRLWVLLMVVVMAMSVFGEGAKEAAVEGVEVGGLVGMQFEAINPIGGEPVVPVVIERFKAAPMLRERVAAGELPSVDVRMPDDPLVLQSQEIGTYGGWMRTMRYPVWIDVLSQRLLLEHLVTWSFPFYEELHPNVAQAWNVSDDATVVTFYLRKGMKWSDGAPFTSDAIVWWFEHIIKNDDLYPSKPAFLLTKGNLPAVTAVDDTTVRFTFTDPNPMFLENAARIRPMPYAPAHYLEQFHPDFVSQDEIRRLMVAGEYDTWMAMFNDRANFYTNPDIPGISAWLPITPGHVEVAKFERNPYYWKVDTEGNQLPYIDGMDHPFVQTAETWFLMALAGEVTYAGGNRVNLPLIMEARDKGDINFAYNWWPPNSRDAAFWNFAHPDPVKRSLIDDRRFRLALIKAIDYDEVNAVIHEDQSIPGWPASSDHLELSGELYRRYTERDVAGANALLDEIGIAERDRAGFRLGPDGGRLTLTLLAKTPSSGPETAELYRGYFEEIGIRAVVKAQSGQLAAQMVEAGSFDLFVTNTAIGGRPMNIWDRGTLTPISRNWEVSRPWARWLLTDGADGVEPPDAVKRLRKIHETAMVEPDAAKRDELVIEALEIWVDNLLAVPGYNEPRAYQLTMYQPNIGNFAYEDEDGVLWCNPEMHTRPPQLLYYRE